MTTYAGAADVIPGALDGVDRATGTISTAADSAESRSAELRTAVDFTEDFWASPSGTAYRVAAQKQIGTTGMLVGPLDTASQAFGTLARELRGARSTVDRALADSVALGMGTSDLVGNPWAVTSFLLANPQHAPTVAGLLGDVAGARISAGSAHTAFVSALTGARDGLTAPTNGCSGPDAVPTNAAAAGSTRTTAGAANRAETAAVTSTTTGPAGPFWSVICAVGATGPSPTTQTGRGTCRTIRSCATSCVVR